MKETFMLVRKQRQEKRNHNKEQSTNLLKQVNKKRRGVLSLMKYIKEMKND